MISDKNFNWIKVDNISVPVDLINVSRVAEFSGLSQPYVSQLLDPADTKRKKPESLKKVRDAIVLLYSNVILLHDHKAA